MDSYTVLFVEDNKIDANLFLQRIASEANNRFHCKSVSNLQAALDRLSTDRIDVVLLDLNLPDSRGLNTLEEILRHDTSVPVVVLTGLSDEELALQALAAGAQDYLIKEDVDAARLVQAILFAVHRKQRELDGVADDLVESKKIRERLEWLTPRESQILTMVVEGQTLKKIASTLGTSYNTVKHQHAALLEKMRATCDADLVRIVMGIGAAELRTSADHGDAEPSQ